MIIRRLFAIGFTCVAFAAYAEHSPRALAVQSDSTEAESRIYDPSGMLKDFKLQAHPEACTGTSESIEAMGRATAQRSEPLFNSSRLGLIPEPVPLGTPTGWRGFRFTDGERVFLGTVCGVVYDQETGHVVFVMSDTPPRAGYSSSSFETRQDSAAPFESHILIPPNGYVSPELIGSY
jgi:hypothetical protein